MFNAILLQYVCFYKWKMNIMHEMQWIGHEECNNNLLDIIKKQNNR